MSTAIPCTDRSILVVDNNPGGTEMFARAFSEAGFPNPLRAVSDSVQALQYLKGEAQYVDRTQYPLPHLLIVEHHRSNQNGWSVIEWVRRQPKFKFLPVIVFSTQEEQGAEKQAHAAGASAYHLKPESFDAFAQTIRRIGEFWLYARIPPA